jgi:hypothetical protein
VVADCFYGDNPGFTEALGAAKVRFVLALKLRKGTWAPAEAAHAPVEAPGELGWQGPRKPGQWRRIRWRFRDGHTHAWWAADARLAGWGPDRRLRLVVATTDPAGLPVHSSWYLLTNLARPASRRAQRADLAEVVRLYGLRNWVEQGDKQVKGELGWADFQVRSDRAICRHWTLVAYTFSFCWQTWFCHHAGQPAAPDRRPSRRPRGGQRRPDIGAEPAANSSWPVAVRAVRAWLTPGACCNAAGGRGRQRPRPGSSNGCLTVLPQASRCTPTSHRNQQTTVSATFLRSGR